MVKKLKKGLAFLPIKRYYICIFHSWGHMPCENLKFKRVEIMNKSKFLRKSLALLLSVLMVVAMIPVGASAADTNTVLAAIYVDGTAYTVANKAVSAEVGSTDVNINVRQLKDGETATILDADGDETDNINLEEGADVDLTEYTGNGNVYTLTLRLTNDSAVTDYKINLTVVPASTSVALKSAVAYLDADQEVKAISTSVSGKTVNVTVPYGYDDEGTLVVTGDDDATVEDEGEISLVNDQTFTVTSEAGNTAKYTIKVTEVAALSSLTIGGVKTTITHVSEDNEEKGEITATFDPSVLTASNTTGKCEAEAFTVAFTGLAGITVKFNETALTSGKTTGAFYNEDEGELVSDGTLTVSYKGAVEYEYAVELKTTTSTDASVVSATVDGEEATVSGTSITATIAKYGDDAEVLVKVAVAEGAVVYNWISADEDNTFSAEYAVSELKKGIVFKVIAQDGETSKQYVLKASAKGEVDTAELKTFALRIGDVDYKGTINGSTVKVTVPFMTTDDDLKDAEVIWTTNPYVGLYDEDNESVVSGEIFANGEEVFVMNSKYTAGTATATVYAKGKVSEDVTATYTITVSLDTPKHGYELGSIIATSAECVNDLESDNTYNGVKKITSKDNHESALTFTVSYTDSNSDDLALYLKSYTTSNSGVAYLLKSNEIHSLDNYVLNSTKTYKKVADDYKAGIVDCAILVVDEVNARKIENGEAKDLNDVDQKSAWIYGIEIAGKPARSNDELNSIKIGETTMKAPGLTGTVAYSVTAADTDDEDSAQFITFSAGAGATVYASADKKVDDDTDYVKLVSGGKKNDDGEAEDASTENGALLLVRDTTKGVVTVYALDGEDAFEAKYLVVVAEDGSFTPYSFGSIKYAAANTEAKITAFSVAGTAGSIKAEGTSSWTITVNAPLGTDLTNLVPTFTVSSGATVNVVNGDPITSGETVYDFSDSVQLKVTSEDGSKSNTYTVKVSASTSFSDVKTTDWYYDNVMAAYKAGYVSGNGDGTFNPTASVTRRDFAIMVYKMMGSKAVSSTASFTDVAADDYAADAIAFLKENDIVSGYEDGTFKPAATITRQEAASILANALNLSGSSESLFTDDAKIANWAKPAVYACKVAGVFNGDEKGNFNPNANIIRAEAATAVFQAASK